MFTPEEYEFVAECIDLRESKGDRVVRNNKAVMIVKITQLQEQQMKEAAQKPDKPPLKEVEGGKK